MAMRHLWCACTKFQPNPASRRALSRSQSGNGSRKTTRIIPSVSNNQILKAMRKSFVYAAGLMCLALSITDCQKELVDQTTPASEPNFELFAQPVTTKTANNGLDTKWVANDAINVFHAEAGSTAYDSDGRFTVKDIETGRFDGTVSTSLSADKSYDWYAFYPYSSYNKTPAGISKDTFGYTTIGGTSQTQTGNGSRAHLAGESCPLYGIASNVASDKVPSISMNHLTSVIKVSVTNNSGEDLTVSSVSFTGTEDIVGTYFINFAASPVAYKSRGNAYVSSTASLTVSNGEALANGSSADFYIALKPFTAKTGSTLKLAVNGYEKTLTLKNEITFTAGHIKPLNFNFDKKVLDCVTLPWSVDGTGGSSIWKNTIGLSQKGLGNDYANTNKPYLTKFDTDKDYVQIKYDSPAAKVKFGVKMFGTSASTMTVQGSADGTAFSDVEAFTIPKTQNKTYSFTTSKSIDASYRYIRLSFTKGGNVGLGAVEITKESTDPRTPLATSKVQAEVRDVNSVYAFWGEIAGAKDYTVTCGTQSITLAGTEHTFTDLAYSTSYTISVVANPTDALVNAPSAAGTTTVTTGANPSGETIVTYQHIFTSKPNVGNNIKLSNVSWKIAASNLGNYNSTNYAGVQFGTKNSSGSITLTSAAWSYKEKTKITEVRVWLNAGTGTPTASVNIGGKEATLDGVVVKQNKNAQSYKDATMLTFTPVDGGDSGIVVIKASSSNAAYICAIEIDCL